MQKKILITILLAVSMAIITPLCFSGQDDSKKVTFTDLIATTSETHLILFGVINNSFTEEMISGVKSGVPVHFSFFIELFQKENNVEQLLTEMEFRHTMTYDTLKDSYKVELGEINNKIVLLQDLKDTQKTMSEVNGVKVIELTNLVPDKTYLLKIKASLFEKTLPLSLHRILPFTWWDRETKWHSLEFNY
ncbi:DUF4390 domain-containing protein [Desulfosediminicola flagellatus]|uniref:DUF4390 domain-containing protein n=1 Tax=Desulfosediminicola flagellatus TaxID=2569541 RepID=UPI0010AD8139|nr:DUF4390 domain-containing protein [Desulfosediminicola flagellatus]